MTDTIISFDTAVLLKQKNFDRTCLTFYTKPNSKMFGLDEHDRIYPIKNISKKLYTAGKHIALNATSVYFAPSQGVLQKRLREKHNIHLVIQVGKGENIWWSFQLIEISTNDILLNYEGSFNTFEEALEVALYSALKLIKL